MDKNEIDDKAIEDIANEELDIINKDLESESLLEKEKASNDPEVGITDDLIIKAGALSGSVTLTEKEKKAYDKKKEILSKKNVIVNIKAARESKRLLQGKKKRSGAINDLVDNTNCYCRVCMKVKQSEVFSESFDSLLDKNGFLSVCSDCIVELYAKLIQTEFTLEKTLLRLCRALNIEYSEKAIDLTKDLIHRIEVKKRKPKNIFGIYTKALFLSKGGMSAKSGSKRDWTFVEPKNLVEIINNSDYMDNKEYYEAMWGKGKHPEEYMFLENELSEWQKTHKSDTKAEQVLLKEICHKELEVDKARTESKPVGNLVKELQDLMKTASVDPSKANNNSLGKTQDTFSSFIKTIEENEPCEYYKDKKLFSDFDNIAWYFDKYITRPLKNFITSSRDFNVDENDEFTEEDEDFTLEDLKTQESQE